MYNGLADSIWVGSKNKPAAAKWVEFLGSADCQDIVAAKAVVFPAIPSATDKADAAFKAKGVDVNGLPRSRSRTRPRSCSRSPTTPHRSTASCIRPWTTSCLARRLPTSLTDANNQVNQLFG